MIRRICFVLILLFLVSLSFAGAGFYEDAGANQYEKVVFDFGSGFEWRRLSTEVDGQYYGHKGASDTWLLNGGEAFVWKDNGSDILSVTLHYRIYKDGTTPPAFSDINVPWDSNVGGNNQRWATTAESIDIIAASGSAGTWNVEFYYSATTNGVNTDPVIYFSNGGANYKLYFDRDVISVTLTSFSAIVQNDGVHLQWSTASEINHAGYNLYRSQDDFAHSLRVNESLIRCSDVSATTGDDYFYVDTPPAPGLYQYALQTVDLDGSTTIAGTTTASTVLSVDDRTASAPRSWSLFNYPNPFNPATMIRFNAPAAAFVTISVFDLGGRRVATLFDGRIEAGEHQLSWNGETDAGRPVASGSYYVRLNSADLVLHHTILKVQ